ncbi:MAG: hypothetical protein WD875_06685 [Pirellulales bacterium]
MDFRAPGQSNERRRRVRADDSVAATLPIRRQANADDRGSRPRSGPRYAERGRPERQPRLMDLVPRRRLWLNVIAVGGLFVIAGLLAGHWATHRADAASPVAPPVAPPAALARTLDVLASDSLAAWTRAGMLAAAAAMAMLVYVVRRHRTDDYGGGYRVWLWAAAWMLAMSADAVGRLRDAWQAIWIAETAWTGPGDGVLWWAVPCLLAAATIGVRLVLDMRECRVSTVWFCAAAIVWTVGQALAAIGPMFADRLRWDLAAAGCSLAGQWFLFVAMNWHARHVVLDASGELRARKKKKKKLRGAAASDSGEGDLTTLSAAAAVAGTAASAESTKRQAFRAATASTTPTATSNLDTSKSPPTLAAKLTFGGRAAHDSAGGANQLSKAERKKLKREIRRAA